MSLLFWKNIFFAENQDSLLVKPAKFLFFLPVGLYV